MRLGAYEFLPSRWPTLVVLLLLPLLIGLGFWQIDRAAEKRALIEARSAAWEQEPIDLNIEFPRAAQSMQRMARARGRFDSDHQFLLDNQTRDGVVGYHILTPLRLDDSNRSILVDRGWVAAPPRRERLPDVTVDESERRVEGRIGNGPAVGLRLGKAYVGNGDWPRRIQYLDFSMMADSLPYVVAPYLLAIGSGASDAKPETMRMGPRRHLGYAVQWFALASALVVIYVGVNTRRRNSV